MNGAVPFRSVLPSVSGVIGAARSMRSRRTELSRNQTRTKFWLGRKKIPVGTILRRFPPSRTGIAEGIVPNDRCPRPKASDTTSNGSEKTDRDEAKTSTPEAPATTKICGCVPCFDFLSFVVVIHFSIPARTPGRKQDSTAGGATAGTWRRQRRRWCR